jgi:hypothetical protein
MAELREAANKEFVAAWLRWRGEKLLPRRADVDLGSIRRLLGSVILFELRTPDTVMVKVAGTQLREHYGFELTGTNYVELAPQAQRPTRQYRMWQSVSRPCGSRLVREHRVQTGRVTLAEVVSVPLDGDRPAAPRMLLAHVRPYTVRYESGQPADESTFVIAGEFTFLDIGAGVPGSTVPD